MKLKHLVLTLVVVSGLSFVGCNSQAKKDAAAKTKIDAVLPPGIAVQVKDGVATLSGEFTDEATKSAVLQSVAGVENVTSVSNNTTVAEMPVINADELISNNLANVMAEYPGVVAVVNDGVVKVSGEITKENWIRLRQSLDALRPQRVDNSLLVIK